MLHRRTPAVIAASAALILAGAAPALADHVHENDFTFEPPGGFDLSDLEASLEFQANLTCADFGLEPAPSSEDWDDQGKVDDPPVGVDNEFVTTTLSGVSGKTHLDVVAKEGFTITAVLVKGGTGGGGTAYFHGPFEDMTANVKDETAQEISHYSICGLGEEDDKTPPPDDEEEPPPDEDDKAKDEKPTDEKTPAPVPTEVPAGHDGSASSVPFGTIGLLAAVAALVTAGAVLIRRRFMHDS